MKNTAAGAPTCCGVFREVEHSPGREADDAGILQATGRRLEEAGFPVAYLAPAELSAYDGVLPALAFSMCEGAPALERLRVWESRGVCVVNRSIAIVNTHRERTIALLEGRRIPMPESRLYECDRPLSGVADDDRRLFSACWVKQATEHKTREGDVIFATDAASVGDALLRLRSRGLSSAVVQKHVEGDLVKFYGVSDAAAAADGGPLSAVWFKWFYPKEHPAAGHAFDVQGLYDIACRAARALELDVWGGDAIVTPGGGIFVIDLNAWPSFALFREEAADSIAAHLEARLRRLARVAV